MEPSPERTGRKVDRGQQMFIAYYDESGDDGFPSQSSPLFVLTAGYIHHLYWKDAFERVRDFRRYLKERCGLPVKIEFHTKQFLLNKNPYRDLALTPNARIEVLKQFCDLIAQLEMRFVNVAIVKPRIAGQGYQVLDTAVKYSVQRIENDLDPNKNPDHLFMVITDSGRVGKMRKTCRKIQRINYIPSRFGPQAYRQDIRSLIEDPLPKDSKESYFIQVCDLVAYVVYLYVLTQTRIAGFSNRLATFVSTATVEDWMERLKPSLNLKAAADDGYGVKIHPA